MDKTNCAFDFTVSRRLDLMMLVALKSLNPTTTTTTTTSTPTVYNGYKRTHGMTHTTRFAIPRALWRPVVCIETAGTTSCRDTSVLFYCVNVFIICYYIFVATDTERFMFTCVHKRLLCECNGYNAFWRSNVSIYQIALAQSRKEGVSDETYLFARRSWATPWIVAGAGTGS